MARGDRPQIMIVNAREFVRYCRACGQACNYTMLGAYAVAKEAGGNY